MILRPDFFIIKYLIAANPCVLGGLFLALVINVLLWRRYLKPTELPLDKVLTGLALIFAFAQLHLAALLAISVLFILLYSKERFDIAFCYRRTIGMICFLMICSLIGIVCTQVPYPAELSLDPVEAFRKLYNYPYIHQRYLTPIGQVKLPLTFLLGVISTIGILLFNRSLLDRRAVAFMLLLMVASISLLGMADTFYVHIRYGYFLFPVYAFVAACMFYLVSHKLSNRFRPEAVMLILVALIGAFQVLTSFRTVVLAKAGDPDRYTPHRVYLDYRTCAELLNHQYANGDYIVALGSAHQAAIYLNHSIDLALKPELSQYKDLEHHYITGSLFFDDGRDLNKLLMNADLVPNANVWILLGTNYLKPGSWQSDLAEHLDDYIVCRAKDNVNSLGKIPVAELFSILSPK